MIGLTRGAASERARVCRAYLANLRHVDNWDLVDASAPGILGLELREVGARERARHLAGQA